MCESAGGIAGVEVAFHCYFDWDLFPNPDSEVFRLLVPQGAIINQVVIDTISVPEPLSGILLLLGLLGGGIALRRMRR